MSSSCFSNIHLKHLWLSLRHASVYQQRSKVEGPVALHCRQLLTVRALRGYLACDPRCMAVAAILLPGWDGYVVFHACNSLLEKQQVPEDFPAWPCNWKNTKRGWRVFQERLEGVPGGRSVLRYRSHLAPVWHIRRCRRYSLILVFSITVETTNRNWPMTDIGTTAGDPSCVP